MSENNSILGFSNSIDSTAVFGRGPDGSLPLTETMLREEPSGNLFGMTQNAGMGWKASEIGRDPYLILSTQGGLRNADGSPVALGYHTGHWEIDQLVKVAAATFKGQGKLPFAAMVSDPCDGRTQGTVGMFDSLPYRNDAAITMRRLIRSLPMRRAVMGVATCDKGLPAMMLALAGCSELPGILVPGGVTLPTEGAEDAGKVQTIGARFSHELIDLEYAADMGCKACGSPGGGCQFLGTAATAQVIAEALGISLPHAALIPSGQPIWEDLAHRSALALIECVEKQISLKSVLTDASIRNAMLVHAAFGGSTNLLLHLPAIAHAAGLAVPTVEDWRSANRAVKRLVDALPNGPRHHPTVQVYLAGGVPEVMLHLRRMGLLDTSVNTVSGLSLDEVLNAWEGSERRVKSKQHLRTQAGIDADDVIVGEKSDFGHTLVFPTGNVAPEGSVIKATAIDPELVDEKGLYQCTGKARVFTDEKNAIRAIKSQGEDALKVGDIIVLIGAGPMGTGMEETYQLTSALKFLPWGKHIPIVTDARFSGVSTGACIGHVGPEALAGGPIGKLVDGDTIAIRVDNHSLEGSVQLIASADGPLDESQAERLLSSRSPHEGLKSHPLLPDDTRLWAALQQVSGGTWKGSAYDADAIIETLEAGMKALGRTAGAGVRKLGGSRVEVRGER